MILALLMAAPLALPAASIAPFPAIAGASRSATAGDETTERVELESRGHVKIVGVFSAPRASSSRAPAVILIHDAGGNREQLTEIGSKLLRQGFAVLSLDLRAHGASASEELDWSEMDETARERLWQLASRDIEVAAGWLRSRRDVHATNLNLVAYRAGCALAVSHARDDENVRTLVLIEAPPRQFGYDLKGGIERLVGLPTYLVHGKAARDSAEQLVSVVHESVGDEFIEIIASRRDGQEVLTDSRVSLAVARWLKEKAFPRRGR